MSRDTGFSDRSWSQHHHTYCVSLNPNAMHTTHMVQVDLDYCHRRVSRQRMKPTGPRESRSAQGCDHIYPTSLCSPPIKTHPRGLLFSRFIGHGPSRFPRKLSACQSSSDLRRRRFTLCKTLLVAIARDLQPQLNFLNGTKKKSIGK